MHTKTTLVALNLRSRFPQAQEHKMRAAHNLGQALRLISANSEPSKMEQGRAISQRECRLSCS